MKITEEPEVLIAGDPFDLYDASKLMEDSYAEYGSYVNTTRAVPGIDGLKTVQRRMLLSVRDLATNSWVKTATVAGRCMHYHPHSEQAAVLIKLVQNGFVLGKGSFGSRLLEILPSAAPRYTSVKAHKKFNESVFRFVDYVPQLKDDDVTEPAYLPVPVPLALTTGSMGIGVGLMQNIPMFDLESLNDARKADDPSYLRAPDGTLIVAGDLKRLWERGKGWIQYGIKCFQEWSKLDGKNVSVVEGSTKVFVPNILSTFEDLLENETVYMRDESTDHLRVVMSRVKNLRRISDEIVHEMCRTTAARSFYYNIYVSVDGAAHRISIRNWLNLMWMRFEEAVDDWKHARVSNMEKSLQLYSLIPEAGPLIIKGKSTEEVAKKLKVSNSIVAEIEGKSMKMLRKTDFNSKIKSLEKSIKEAKSVTVDDMYESFVESLSTKE